MAVERCAGAKSAPPGHPMVSGVVVGASVWSAAPATSTDEAYVAGTVKSIDGDGKSCVVEEGGQDRTVKVADVSLANPPGMVAPDNAYLIHISEGARPPARGGRPLPPRNA